MFLSLYNESECQTLASGWIIRLQLRLLYVENIYSRTKIKMSSYFGTKGEKDSHLPWREQRYGGFTGPVLSECFHARQRTVRFCCCLSSKFRKRLTVQTQIWRHCCVHCSYCVCQRCFSLQIYCFVVFMCVCELYMLWAIVWPVLCDWSQD